MHLPLNRWSDVYQREGIDFDVLTLADRVGAAAATLRLLVDVMAERIHTDDTTVPVLPKGKTRTGRSGPMRVPAAVFFYSPVRGGVHPEQHLEGYAGLMQGDPTLALASSTRPPAKEARSGGWQPVRPRADLLRVFRKAVIDNLHQFSRGRFDDALSTKI